MYADYSPEPNVLVEKVLVIERDEVRCHTIDEVIEEARGVGAVFEGDDGDRFSTLSLS